MSFDSYHFWLFLVIVAIVYYLIPKLTIASAKIQSLTRQIFLLAASILFYSLINIRFLPFLLAIGLLTYCSAFLVNRSKSFFILCTILITAPLFFLKYTNFIIGNFSSTKLELLLPIGLSFYTFQCLAYIFEIRKNKYQPEKNPLTVLLYSSFFPVITSGPIQRPAQLFPQLKAPTVFDYKLVTDGMKLFAWGFFQKYIVADSLNLYVNYIFDTPSIHHGCACALAAILYSFQIYTDFSGYSDMSIGIANILGFKIAANFDHPYLSDNCSVFWKRWHISLSSWLKDYIYIPLGGSRVKKSRSYLNLLITFFVSGVWHGAAWTFIVWGLLHGIYQCVSRLITPIKTKLNFPKPIRIFNTFILITFAWIFFRANNLSDAILLISKFGEIPNDIIAGISHIDDYGLSETIRIIFSFDSGSFQRMEGILKMVLKLCCFIGISIFTYNHDGLLWINKQAWYVKWPLYIILMMAIIFLLPTTTSTNFIYTNF